jgi:hypothetical protein
MNTVYKRAAEPLFYYDRQKDYFNPYLHRLSSLFPFLCSPRAQGDLLISARLRGPHEKPL